MTHLKYWKYNNSLLFYDQLVCSIQIIYKLTFVVVVLFCIFFLLQISMNVGYLQGPVPTDAWTLWGVTVVSAIMDTCWTLMENPASVRQIIFGEPNGCQIHDKSEKLPQYTLYIYTFPMCPNYRYYRYQGTLSECICVLHIPGFPLFYIYSFLFALQRNWTAPLFAASLVARLREKVKWAVCVLQGSTWLQITECAKVIPHF